MRRYNRNSRVLSRFSEISFRFFCSKFHNVPLDNFSEFFQRKYFIGYMVELINYYFDNFRIVLIKITLIILQINFIGILCIKNLLIFSLIRGKSENVFWFIHRNNRFHSFVNKSILLIRYFLMYLFRFSQIIEIYTTIICSYN